jgi:hypothetical protein
MNECRDMDRGVLWSVRIKGYEFQHVPSPVRDGKGNNRYKLFTYNGVPKRTLMILPHLFLFLSLILPHPGRHPLA